MPATATATAPDPRAAAPLLRVEDLTVELGNGVAARRVLKGVSFDIPRGSTLALVGESGSGKTTLARTLVGVHRPSSGRILVDGAPLRSSRGRAGAATVQMIPQDPYSSFDPRRTVAQSLAEALDPIRARVRPARTRIAELLSQVSLDPDTMDPYPHEFSGGQRQRLAIARALAPRPRFVIADEITSALDLTTQAEILNLLADLRRRLSLTMLFISHALAVVRHVSDTVAVLLHGDLVELGPTGATFAKPNHPYTAQLLASVPGDPRFRLDGPATTRIDLTRAASSPSRCTGVTRPPPGAVSRSRGVTWAPRSATRYSGDQPRVGGDRSLKRLADATDVGPPGVLGRLVDVSDLPLVAVLRWLSHRRGGFWGWSWSTRPILLLIRADSTGWNGGGRCVLCDRGSGRRRGGRPGRGVGGD
ncbi:ATP-binding cassette domain-containing protein [Streptomyces iakyrus]|uniref:ATP-binding cassette domain-containing protein n=1 Tax=Streptomyces iakyrus TaxID=68219 RepID=A0ABW8FRX0_9ACTN